MARSSVALDILVLATAWAHVLLAPYTKVEESFNLHAAHDILMYGVGRDALSKYDHFTFPGAVPRTFIPSFLLVSFTKPVLGLLSLLGVALTKYDLQILLRISLASLNAAGLCVLRRAVSRYFGRTTAVLFAVLTCSQFHVPFWMGRTIPNMFSFLPVNLAMALLLNWPPRPSKTADRGPEIALLLLVPTAVIIRAEVSLFIAPISLQLLWTNRITFRRLIKLGFITATTSIVVTILVDSYFWNINFLWPELSGIYFNVFKGHSADWGVSPPLTYITSYLPKLLLSALPLSIIGVMVDTRIRQLIIPSVIYVALISLLSHKEWRFIVYVMPIFNIAGAKGAAWLLARSRKQIARRFLSLVVLGSIIANCLVTLVSLKTSMMNYPGGFAMESLHRSCPADSTSTSPQVHISNLAAQTGASLFLQSNAPPFYGPSRPSVLWIYNKTENLTMAELDVSPFSHLISETPPSKEGANWSVVETISGLTRWTVDWPRLKSGITDLDARRLLDALQLVQDEKLWILRRV